jgi:hypothetical protein
MKNMIARFAYLLVILTLITACNSDRAGSDSQTPGTMPQATNTAAEIPEPETPVPAQPITLKSGDYYFSEYGKQEFLFSRNVAGYRQEHYNTFIDWAKSGGSSFIRIQLDSWGMGYTVTGEVDEAWAARWDKVFDTAEENGILVLPVFSGWFDWNAGEGYSTWNENPLNIANGGPVASPSELFQKDSAAQVMWLKWMQALVERWRDRENIIAWEIFSEVNLATGSSESSGIDFVNTAASLIRALDPGRPVTASIADTGKWPNFYQRAEIDFINIHPYPPSAQLDRAIIQEAGNYLLRYKKPVLIGESGLNAESPEMYPEKAQTGIRHAVWAAVVSGAMNGRALYWEDSYGLFFSKLGIPWMMNYKTIELPAEEFVKGVDFAGFKPLSASFGNDIWGAAVGNDSMVLGWFRDAACEPPDYPQKSALSGQSVTITAPGNSENWKVEFYSTEDGVTVLGSVDVSREGSAITIPLPEFSDDIAFKAFAR